MSKKSRFREPFEKQHGKHAKALFESATHHLYFIHWLLSSELSWEKSLLLTWKIWWVLVKTLAVDEKYLVLHGDNLTISIQKQLSQKEKTISKVFFAFSKSRLNFKHFQKQRWLSELLYFQNYGVCVS